MSLPIRPDDPITEQAKSAVLDYMLAGAKRLGELPSWGFFCGADTRTGGVSVGPVMDLSSVPTILQRLTEPQLKDGPDGTPVTILVEAVALAFPFRTRATLSMRRLPRVCVIVAEPHTQPTMDAYMIDLNPLSPGIFRAGALVDVAPELLQDLTLWGVSYPSATGGQHAVRIYS